MYLLKQFIKYDTIRRVLTLNIFEEYGELEAGEHEFAWSFIVPSNTAVCYFAGFEIHLIADLGCIQ
jgi:hypothetical protein